MPGLQLYNLFISHAWGYSAEYERFIELLNRAPYFIYRNYSIPYYDRVNTRTAQQLREALYNQIRPTHLVVILAGMYVAYSDWIQEEIDIAWEFSKPILGVYPWGSERAPIAVQEAADEMVGWNTYSIVSAIRRLAI